MFCIPKSYFIINSMILNTKKSVAHEKPNWQEMHVKYHLYKQLKADEYKANIIIWLYPNLVRGGMWFNLLHALRIM